MQKRGFTEDNNMLCLNYYTVRSLKTFQFKKKVRSSLYWCYTPKHVTSGEAHLRGSAPGQRRNVAAVASNADLTGPEIEPQISRPIACA